MTHLTLHEEIYKTRIEYQKIKAERDTLIDDIAVLKGNISRLEQIRDIKDSVLKDADIKIKTLERENEKLKRENRRKHYSANENNKYYKELWKRNEEYIKEVAEITEKYITLTNHIRLKAENNPGVSRYIDLVNYIDRLERADNER
ncbi:hypothetical protein FEZ53_06445 [Staphylococcus xylosus]|uniref:Uncharacterized protein n=1 Tax=Staphylococcus xylosus TaxID=1288 RepID=A0A5R9B8Z3_STAXY|nr:hypothetical protein [Staphylococcus xylosus]TLP91923.1 hypothetical protein FEZ53_06445 [Staphylococcus xylosus]